MDVTWVYNLPQNTGEALATDVYALGIVPVRLVVLRRVEGWCVYGFVKYPPQEYAELYGSPVPFERVLTNGDKLPEKFARELFPEMEGRYIN